MKSTKENAKTADERRKQAKRKIAILLAKLERLSEELGKCSQDMAAVEAVVREEKDDDYADVDMHPGSLDLPQALTRGKR
jgi:chromosome segregation ATPase